MANKTIAEIGSGTTIASGDLVEIERPGSPNVSEHAPLGDAAGKDVGTVAGTVAAGDDSRFGTVPDAYVTNAKLANMAQATIKGRAAGAGTGAPGDLSASDVKTIIGDASTSASGLVELATAAEYRTGTDAGRALNTKEVWDGAQLAALTDGANIAVDLSTGFNFGGSSNAVLALGGNRNLSAPSNTKTGQSGILWFGASSSTRTLTLNAAWLLMAGVEVGPYSITTSQILGVAYVVRASAIYVTAILRRAA